MAPKSKALVPLFKWAIAILLLVIVVRSGKLSPGHVLAFAQNPQKALSCFLLIFTVVLLSFLRWKIILWALNMPLSYFVALKLGMVGQFFSTVIPGAVGGDLVKAVYIAKRFPRQKTKAVSTIFVDRIVGLAGLLFLGSVGYVLGYSHLSSLQTQGLIFVKSFGMMLVIGAASVLLGLIFFPQIAKFLPKNPPRFIRYSFVQNFWTQFYNMLQEFKERVPYLYFVVIFSSAMHCLMVTGYWIIAVSIHGPAPWGDLDILGFILATVLGSCALAIPITPLGLGVGQIAYGAIFLAVGAPSTDFGMSLITNMQIVQIILGLCGVFFFLSYKHQMSDAITNVSV